MAIAPRFRETTGPGAGGFDRTQLLLPMAE